MGDKEKLEREITALNNQMEELEESYKSLQNFERHKEECIMREKNNVDVLYELFGNDSHIFSLLDERMTIVNNIHEKMNDSLSHIMQENKSSIKSLSEKREELLSKLDDKKEK